MKVNVNPLPGIFGNITPAEMQAITERYNELSKLTDSMLIRNKKALASATNAYKGKTK